MADIHIDEFFHDCVKALVLLYKQFPRKTSLYIDDLITAEPTDEFGIPTRRHQACFDALLWLSEEGYIRFFDRVRHDGLDQVVLTEKSFLRLSLPESPIEDRQELPAIVSRKRSTLAWAMKQSIKSGSTEAINQSAQQFFAQKNEHS